MSSLAKACEHKYDAIFPQEEAKPSEIDEIVEEDFDANQDHFFSEGMVVDGEDETDKPSSIQPPDTGTTWATVAQEAHRERNAEEDKLEIENLRRQLQEQKLLTQQAKAKAVRPIRSEANRNPTASIPDHQLPEQVMEENKMKEESFSSPSRKQGGKRSKRQHPEETPPRKSSSLPEVPDAGDWAPTPPPTTNQYAAFGLDEDDDDMSETEVSDHLPHDTPEVLGLREQVDEPMSEDVDNAPSSPRDKTLDAGAKL